MLSDIGENPSIRCGRARHFDGTKFVILHGLNHQSNLQRWESHRQPLQCWKARRGASKATKDVNWQIAAERVAKKDFTVVASDWC